MEDLWGFKDYKDLKKSSSNMPEMILKEQFSLISDKTDGIIYGKSTNVTINNTLIDDFKMASIFDFVVPRLDNYKSTVLIVYSNPETDYPVAITVGNSYEDDLEDFTPDYYCKDYGEFKTAIVECLANESITHKIRVLYSKAMIY